MILPLQFGAKLWKQGNSLILTVPKDFREVNQLKEGDFLEIFARRVSKEELKKVEEMNRIKSSYPYGATGKIIHKEEDVAVLNHVFFRNFEYRAGTLSPGESFENLPSFKGISGIIYLGHMLPSASEKKHYKNYVLKGDKIMKDLLFSDIIKLKTSDGKEFELKDIRFEEDLPLRGGLNNVRFEGYIKK